jgi:hypothetical protein
MSAWYPAFEDCGSLQSVIVPEAIIPKGQDWLRSPARRVVAASVRVLDYPSAWLGQMPNEASACQFHGRETTDFKRHTWPASESGLKSEAGFAIVAEFNPSLRMPSAVNGQP